jgi:chromosome segregation ATPase
MRPLKRRLSTPTSHVEGLQPPAPKKLKQESGDSEGAKALRGRSLTPWSPIPDSLQPSLKEEDEKMKVEVEDLREEMGIQEHLNDALKEENAAAVAYAKKLEEQVRGLKTNVRELRERLRGITWELEDERQEKREKKEQVRGLQNDVKGLREQVHGLNKELEEKDGREREEKAEKKRVKRRKMDTFWDGRVFD